MGGLLRIDTYWSPPLPAMPASAAPSARA